MYSIRTVLCLSNPRHDCDKKRYSYGPGGIYALKTQSESGSGSVYPRQTCASRFSSKDSLEQLCSLVLLWRHQLHWHCCPEAHGEHTHQFYQTSHFGQNSQRTTNKLLAVSTSIDIQLNIELRNAFNLTQCFHSHTEW